MHTINRHQYAFGGVMSRIINGSCVGALLGLHIVMPLFARVFWLKMKYASKHGPAFIRQIENADRAYCRPGEMKGLVYDIITCIFLYAISMDEYFMFGFQGKTHRERDRYIGDHELKLIYQVVMGNGSFDLLEDKWAFYCATRPYFKRDVCLVRDEGDREGFRAFAAKHPRCFLKPNEDSCGRGCRLLEIGEDVDAIFEKLVGEGHWVVEELIVQDEVMAAWNASSVNTFRLCSFKEEGSASRVCHAFMRVGRAGSVVDNGGAGGIFASIDPETGILCTDGADESRHTYAVHPDSGMPFKGEQIPRWEELLGICREVHATLPPECRCVGFDFALTDAGWVLGEGNWGQYVAQQVTFERGMRREIEELMGVTVK